MFARFVAGMFVLYFNWPRFCLLLFDVQGHFWA